MEILFCRFVTGSCSSWVAGRTLLLSPVPEPVLLIMSYCSSAPVDQRWLIEASGATLQRPLQTSCLTLTCISGACVFPSTGLLASSPSWRIVTWNQLPPLPTTNSPESVYGLSLSYSSVQLLDLHAEHRLIQEPSSENQPATITETNHVPTPVYNPLP